MNTPDERKAELVFDNKVIPLTVIVEGGKLAQDSVKDIQRLLLEHSDTREALEELVSLSGHYAGLLNDYDGGERMTFENADAWIERLREVGKL